MSEEPIKPQSICKECKHCSKFVDEKDMVTLNITFGFMVESTPYIGICGATCDKLGMSGIFDVLTCDGYQSKEKK